jgi:hypothetical protein
VGSGCTSLIDGAYRRPYDELVPRFLSDEWIDAMDRAAAAHGGPRVDGGTMVIQHVVTGLPADHPADTPERCYHLVLTPESARVAEGRAEDPTVTFTTSYRVASDVSSGTRSAQAAFMAGELRVGGSVDQLIATHGSLADADGPFAELRATTEY